MIELPGKKRAALQEAHPTPRSVRWHDWAVWISPDFTYDYEPNPDKPQPGDKAAKAASQSDHPMPSSGDRGDATPGAATPDKRKHSLYDVPLRIPHGELVLIYGPSGCGKTTLLTLIGALRSVQNGEMYVLNHAMHRASMGELVDVRKEIGFIFQHHNLFASLDATQNVRLALDLFPISAGVAKARAQTLLRRLSLEEQHLKFKPGKLSGGLRQRVAIARALVHRPSLVLADEPTAALDKVNVRRVMELLKGYTRGDCNWAEGSEAALANGRLPTVIMVTHDDSLREYADRLIYMAEGRMSGDETPGTKRDWIKVWRALRDCRLFATYRPHTLWEFEKRFSLENFDAGTVLIREGEVPDAETAKFYILADGEVEIHKELPDAQGKLVDTHIRDLGPSDFFGEIALLEDKPRTATVKAKTDVVVYSLNKDDFLAACREAGIEAELGRISTERQQLGTPPIESI